MHKDIFHVEHFIFLLLVYMVITRNATKLYALIPITRGRGYKIKHIIAPDYEVTDKHMSDKYSTTKSVQYTCAA